MNQEPSDQELMADLAKLVRASKLSSTANLDKDSQALLLAQFEVLLRQFQEDRQRLLKEKQALSAPEKPSNERVTYDMFTAQYNEFMTDLQSCERASCSGPVHEKETFLDGNVHDHNVVVHYWNDHKGTRQEVKDVVSCSRRTECVTRNWEEHIRRRRELLSLKDSHIKPLRPVIEAEKRRRIATNDQLREVDNHLRELDEKIERYTRLTERILRQVEG